MADREQPLPESKMAHYRNVTFLEEPPEGWHRIDGATTAPVGWEWWAKGSLFGGGYKQALVRCRDGKKPSDR